MVRYSLITREKEKKKQGVDSLGSIENGSLVSFFFPFYFVFCPRSVIDGRLLKRAKKRRRRRLKRGKKILVEREIEGTTAK